MESFARIRLRRSIIATELRRDLPQNLDDNFEILIDSARPPQCLRFQINPLGTQSDGLITEERRTEEQDYDSEWDGVWLMARYRTGLDDHGHPFSTLNFTQSKNVVWGLNFKRFIRRRMKRTSGQPTAGFGIAKVSEAGELRGIRRHWQRQAQHRKPYAGGVDRLSTRTGTDLLHTGGVDIKYGLRSNLVANLTANTDFADTDVDEQQFNLTPFKIFFPEKRQFFLENAGVFDFSTGFQDLLFFSRQIGIDPVTGQEVPDNGGAKSRFARQEYEVGVMEASTARRTEPFRQLRRGARKAVAVWELLCGDHGH